MQKHNLLIRKDKSSTKLTTDILTYINSSTKETTRLIQLSDKRTKTKHNFLTSKHTTEFISTHEAKLSSITTTILSPRDVSTLCIPQNHNLTCMIGLVFLYHFPVPLLTGSFNISSPTDIRLLEFTQVKEQNPWADEFQYWKGTSWLTTVSFYQIHEIYTDIFQTKLTAKNI